MAQHYDFKIMLAAKMTRLLNRVVQPGEITVGVPSAPTFTTPRNTVIDVTIGEITMKVAYDRFNLNARMLGASSARTAILVEKLDYEDILSKVNLQYGTDFIFSDFETVDVDSDASTIVFTFKNTNVRYTGTFNVKVALNLSGEVEFTNLWRLFDSDIDEGAMSVPLGGVWTYPAVDGIRWGKLGNGRTPLSFPTGCELPLTGEYLYDFEMYITAAARYLCVLGSDPTADGYVRTLGSLYFFNQQMYLYQVTGQIGPAFPLNTPFRLTFHGSEGQLMIYADGALITTIPQPDAVWKCFRNSESGATQLGENSYIRNFKVLRRAPNSVELSQTLAGRAIIPKYPLPVNEVATELNDWSNKGSAVSKLNPAINSVLYNNKPFFGFKAAMGPILLGPVLNFTGDFTLDLEIATVQTTGYNAIFKAVGNNNTFSTGDFTTITSNHGERHKPYLYLVSQTPLSLKEVSGTPVRHTVVRKNGVVTWYENGVQASIAQASDAATNFTWKFFNASRGFTLFRNLRNWNYALTASQLADLFANK